MKTNQAPTQSVGIEGVNEMMPSQETSAAMAASTKCPNVLMSPSGDVILMRDAL